MLFARVRERHVEAALQRALPPTPPASKMTSRRPQPAAASNVTAPAKPSTISETPSHGDCAHASPPHLSPRTPSPAVENKRPDRTQNHRRPAVSPKFRHPRDQSATPSHARASPALSRKRNTPVAPRLSPRAIRAITSQFAPHCSHQVPRTSPNARPALPPKPAPPTQNRPQTQTRLAPANNKAPCPMHFLQRSAHLLRIQGANQRRAALPSQNASPLRRRCSRVPETRAIFRSSMRRDTTTRLTHFAVYRARALNFNGSNVRCSSVNRRIPAA